MATRNTGTRKPATTNPSVSPHSRKGRVPGKSHATRHQKRQKFLKVSTSIPKELRRVKKESGERITYVLDTNVIMSAWDSIFQFEEHNVCIVSQVWIELDKHKKGRSDESWNSRKAIKIIDSLVAGKTKAALMLGIPLIPPETSGKW